MAGGGTRGANYFSLSLSRTATAAGEEGAFERVEERTASNPAGGFQGAGEAGSRAGESLSSGLAERVSRRAPARASAGVGRGWDAGEGAASQHTGEFSAFWPTTPALRPRRLVPERCGQRGRGLEGRRPCWRAAVALCGVVCSTPPRPLHPSRPFTCCTGPSSVSLRALSFLRLSPGTASSSQRRLPAPASLAAGCGEDSGRTGRARLLPVCRARVRPEPRGLRGPPRAGPPARSSTQGEGQGSSRVFDSSPHVVRAVY